MLTPNALVVRTRLVLAHVPMIQTSYLRVLRGATIGRERLWTLAIVIATLIIFVQLAVNHALHWYMQIPKVMGAVRVKHRVMRVPLANHQIQGLLVLVNVKLSL